MSERDKEILVRNLMDDLMKFPDFEDEYLYLLVESIVYESLYLRFGKDEEEDDRFLMDSDSRFSELKRYIEEYVIKEVDALKEEGGVSGRLWDIKDDEY